MEDENHNPLDHFDDEATWHERWHAATQRIITEFQAMKPGRAPT